MYKEYEWILDQAGCLGHITKVHDDNKISARFIRNSAGYEMNRASILDVSEIEKAPLERFEESLPDLIELALVTHDREWFKDLVSGLSVEAIESDRQ